MFAPVLVLLLPWACALALTPLVIRWATRRGLLDHPTARKAHSSPVPLLGGVGVLASIAIGLALVVLQIGPLDDSALLISIGLGAFAMLGLGVCDDVYDVAPRWKLAGQVAIAAATWFAGIRVGAVDLPFGIAVPASEFLSLVITVCWLVLITNAFNLIDGMDGLATGVAVIAALTMYLLAAEHGGQTVPVLVGLALAGALAGFLRFNLPPARIFLGDGGALFVGYVIGVLAIASMQKNPTAMVLAVPLLAAGVPLLDTLLSIARRVASQFRQRGVAGLRPAQIARAVATADRGHLHHLLLRGGWNERHTLFALYAISAGLALVALWTRRMSPDLRWGVFVGVLVCGYLAQRSLEARAVRRESLEAARMGSMAARLDPGRGPSPATATTPSP